MLFDPELIAMSDYIHDYEIKSEFAFETALYCLLDSLGCAVLALNFPECTRLLNLKTSDPVKAAFNIGTLIRWLDYNDTWLAAEWGHPSDNLGGILAVMTHPTYFKKNQVFTVQDCLDAMIRAYEIQGVIALENSFNAVGLDHVVLVKVATAGVVTKLLTQDKDKTLNALSNAWIDGHSLRTYRHSPNTGSRKSWAAGDATSRGVWLCTLVMKGEQGYATALSAPRWGLYDVFFQGVPFKISQPYGSYVMENILFKIAYPAEFHGQTAIECALKLVDINNKKFNINNIKKIMIYTQLPAINIIDKTGELHNAADRDHCLQYMVALALLTGEITAQSYSDAVAQQYKAEINQLRNKMIVLENPQYTRDYLDPQKRSIANKIEIHFMDSSPVLSQEVHYPLGHRCRRKEELPWLMAKFKANLSSRFSEDKVNTIISLIDKKDELLNMPVSHFLSYFLP